LTRWYDRPWLLLSLTALFWAGNAVAGRLSVGEISPMTLTLLRWTGACLVLLAWRGKHLRAVWPAVQPRIGFVLFLGAVGFTGFNALLYGAAHWTSGINLLIIQGAIPGLIMLGTGLAFGERIGVMQVTGMMATMLGVVLTASDGSLERLTKLAFNAGDLLMLGACLCYAAYALLLRKRPAVPGLDLFFFLALGAALTAVVALAVEQAVIGFAWPTVRGWLIVVYCVIFPSICSQIFFIRGVELIGAARAGLCVNLIPVFGAVLMVGIGEPFTMSDAVALAFVLGGVTLAERFRPRPAAQA
jgi:drug/metabolite transporter (DMT)-like permease